jgi:hypothetical protein
VVLGFFKKSF